MAHCICIFVGNIRQLQKIYIIIYIDRGVYWLYITYIYIYIFYNEIYVYYVINVVICYIKLSIQIPSDQGLNSLNHSTYHPSEGVWSFPGDVVQAPPTTPDTGIPEVDGVLWWLVPKTSNGPWKLAPCLNGMDHATLGKTMLPFGYGFLALNVLNSEIYLELISRHDVGIS